MAERVLRVTATGAVTGAFIVAEERPDERPDERLVIVPDLSDEAMFAQWGTNPSSVENYKCAVTPEEFTTFEAQHGPPDGG
jgi:hypothetical protein